MTGAFEGELVTGYAKVRRTLNNDSLFDRVIDLEGRLTRSETHYRQKIERIEEEHKKYITELQKENARLGDIIRKFFGIPQEYEKVFAQTVSLRSILSIVSYQERRSVNEICSHRRDKPTVRVRFICIYIACEMTKLSLGQIGQMMGDRDHTTIGHARDVGAGLMETDPDFRDRVLAYQAMLSRKNYRNHVNGGDRAESGKQPLTPELQSV